jgi:nucleotide-binding universal stress UspA family protein
MMTYHDSECLAMSSQKSSIPSGENRPIPLVFKKVLIAFDGSDHAMNAFIVAEELAKRYNAQLVVLTAVELPFPYMVPRTPPADISVARKYAVDDAKSKVDSLALRARSDGVDAKGEVLDKGGSPVKAILEYAEEQDVDLIVAGTRGLGGFPKMLVGSVSSGLLSHAHCGVLVVR